MVSSSTVPAVMILFSIGVLLAVYMGARYVLMPKKRKQYVFSERNFLYLVGLALFGFGLYVCPLGTMEFFQSTKDYFNLSFMENYLLWIVIAGLLMAVGIGLMLMKRSKRYVKHVLQEKV